MGGLTWEKRDDGIKAGWGKLFQFGLTILLCQALGFRQNPMLSLLGWRNGTSSFHLKETAILDHLKIQKNKLCHICVYIDVLSNMQFFKFTHCQVNTSSHLYFETIKTPFFPSRLCRNNFSPIHHNISIQHSGKTVILLPRTTGFLLLDKH